MSNEQNNDTREICVYYNSACPVCNAGIEYQKKVATDQEISWGDIHKDNSLAENVSADLERSKKYLHLTDRDGQVKVGIDAFIVIWGATKSQAWLAKVFSLPFVRQIAKLGYFLFANALYKWNRWKKNW